jgi:hypothetical protein
MTEYLKLLILALIAIAFLILPSSAFIACDYSYEDPESGNFSSLCEAQIWYEYCTSWGIDDFSDLDGYDTDGTASENRSVPCCSPPVAYDSTVTMNENTPVEIILHATDPDGDTMTYSISSGPSDGTLGTITGNMVVYTPAADYTGVDSFIFRAHDGTCDSNTATVTLAVEPDCSAHLSHVFYGTVTIDGEPAPEYTGISAAGPGVRTDSAQNPVATKTDGSYGSSDNTTQNLVVQGSIEDGAPLTFYVDGVQAEVYDVSTSGPWQSAYPFRAGEVTNLNIRVPPPDNVYINAISVTISNSTYGYTQKISVEKQPWMEIRVTKGMFDILISATGYHDFSGYPILGRSATLGIYEGGNPVSREMNVAFGSRTVSYEYVATETRTFDLSIYVDDRPEINEVRHMTVYVITGYDG